MAYPIKDRPEGCCNPDIRGDRSCWDCYHSFIKNGTWYGTDECWFSECLEVDFDRLSDDQKALLHI